MKLIDEQPLSGIDYQKTGTKFTLWAPTQRGVKLAIYLNWETDERTIYTMKKKGEYFSCFVAGDLDGKFYTYLIGKNEVTDPYSIASSMNSNRSAIIDLKTTNPCGWEDHHIPENTFKNPIIYELHIKDYTFLKNSGVKYPGKYLGLAEGGTNYKGYPTALNHLKQLGVTHIQIMPFYDFISVDENPFLFENNENYNWGYDPELYNVPEGSYSLDSRDPKSRIIELKMMIQAIHEAGMSVVMDVVYNHTYKSEQSNFQVIVPNYYYRTIEQNFSNGSGCGNEFASEKKMVQKFLLCSLKYWMKEYKVDGFRFDLFGLIDRDTMKIIHDELRLLNSKVILYGEPWAGGESALPVALMSTKGTQRGLKFAMFNDNFRNAIKGDNDGTGKGYIQGNYSLKKNVEIGIAGSIDFDSERKGFCESANETINYVNSHDNMIMVDKLKNSALEDDFFYKRYMLAFSILFTSFGIPFIYEGNEFMHSKNMIKNSYNAPISINGINWELAIRHHDMVKFFSEMILLRKEYGSIFGIVDPKKIKDSLTFISGLRESMIGYTICMEHGLLLIFHHAGLEKIEFQQEELEKFLGKKILDNKLIWSQGKRKKETIESVFIEGVDTVILETKVEGEK